MILREKIKNLLLDVRALDYLTQQEDFATLYASSDAGMRYTIEVMCFGCAAEDPRTRSACLEGLRSLVKVRQVTVAQLKDRAQQLGISGYSRMTKADLLIALEKFNDKSANGQDRRTPTDFTQSGIESILNRLQDAASGESVREGA